MARVEDGKMGFPEKKVASASFGCEGYPATYGAGAGTPCRV